MGEHKAGPELDALVAEKVMGLVIMPHPTVPKLFNWRDDDGKLVGRLWRVNEDAVRRLNTPKYSTDIAAAWTVLEKIRPQRFTVRHIFAKELQRIIGDRLGLNNIEPVWAAIYHMTPEDICRAALAAVEQ